MGEVKNINKLATGASKVGTGWQESANDHTTTMAGKDKQQKHAVDDEGRKEEGKGGKEDGDGNEDDGQRAMALVTRAVCDE
jgi:hypothetical protein